RDPGAVHDVDHVGDVLVGLGHLLGQGGQVAGAHLDPARLELAVDRAAAAGRLGLRAWPASAGAAAARAGRLAPGALGAAQDEAVAPHVARDDHRLADRAVARRHVRVARPEGAGRALAVHAQAAADAVDLVLLPLGDVVADVVEDLDPERALA